MDPIDEDPADALQQEIDIRMGRLLLMWRRAVHLDLVDAADLSGVPSLRIAALEKGKAKIPIRKSECKSFAYAYGVSPTLIERIASGEQLPEPKPPTPAA